MQQICWFSRSYGKTENHLLTDYNRSAHGQFIFVNKTWSNPFFCFPFDFWTFWCVFELFEGNGQKLVHFDFFWSFGVWKLLPLQGALLLLFITQGDCPGLGASALSGRVGITKNPSKYIIFLKNITYIIYYITNLYSFRFIFVSLQQI